MEEDKVCEICNGEGWYWTEYPNEDSTDMIQQMQTCECQIGRDSEPSDMSGATEGDR